MSEIGLSCWLRDCKPYGCKSSYDYTPPRGQSANAASEALHERAGKAGWVIGHMDGQAHYACPEHADTLFDPAPLVSYPKE